MGVPVNLVVSGYRNALVEDIPAAYARCVPFRAIEN
jgi:hypothetical protein